MQNLIRASLFTPLQPESQLSILISRIFEHGCRFSLRAPRMKLGVSVIFFVAGVANFNVKFLLLWSHPIIKGNKGSFQHSKRHSPPPTHTHCMCVMIHRFFLEVHIGVKAGNLVTLIPTRWSNDKWPWLCKNSFNHHNNSLRYGLLLFVSAFARQKNWVTERLRDLSRDFTPGGLDSGSVLTVIVLLCFWTIL